jgi:hypothetical protein
MRNIPITLSAAAFAAFLSLAACNKQSHTIVAGDRPDPQAKDLAKAKPVALPPSIQASRTYRCKDNSLVYIDFYTNNTAMVRKTKGGEPPIATLTSEKAGGAYKANGYTISGNSQQITYSAPGKGSQSCRA